MRDRVEDGGLGAVGALGRLRVGRLAAHALALECHVQQPRERVRDSSEQIAFPAGGRTSVEPAAPLG